MSRKLRIDFDTMTEQEIADNIIDAMFMALEFNYRYAKERGNTITVNDVFKRLKYEPWQKKLFTYYGVEKTKIELKKKRIRFVEDVDEQERPRIRARIVSYA